MNRPQKSLLSAFITLGLLYLLFSGRVSFISVEWGVPAILIMQFLLLKGIYNKDKK